MKSDPEVRQVVDQFQLGLPNSPVSGQAGELLGRGTGSSLEFQEHREYLPGDDIRHLDWAAYARTDALMIRMYREEISPRTQIFLDGSASMSTGDGKKSKVARQLASSFSLMVSALGARPSVTLLADQVPPRQMTGDEIELLTDTTLNATGNFSEMVMRGHVALRPQSARILVSDFLFPHDPVSLIRRLSADCSLFWVIQVLTEFESDPGTIGGRRLVDVESDEFSDLRINSTTVQRYKRRLSSLQLQLREEVRRHGGHFVTVVAEHGLRRICMNELCRTGILRPR